MHDNKRGESKEYILKKNLKRAADMGPSTWDPSLSTSTSEIRRELSSWMLAATSI
jgi:hypothetical protein